MLHTCFGQLQVIHKYYCELHRETNFYPRKLALYEIPKYDGNTDKVAEIIPLDNILSIKVVDKKYMFKIMTSDKQYIIGVNTFQEAYDWVDAINSEIIGPPIPGVVCEYLPAWLLYASIYFSKYVIALGIL